MISCKFPPIAFTVNGKRLRSQNNDRKTTPEIILPSRIMCESELFTPSQGWAYLSLLEANEQAVRVSLLRLGVSGSTSTNGGGFGSTSIGPLPGQVLLLRSHRDLNPY